MPPTTSGAGRRGGVAAAVAAVPPPSDNSNSNSNGNAATTISGGYDTSLFVDQPIDSNLICTVCHQVLRKPVSVCSNGHVSCESCLDEWKLTSTAAAYVKCPDCRIPVLAQSCLVRPLQSMIFSLKVKCPNESTSSVSISTEEEEDEEDSDIDSEGNNDSEEEEEDSPDTTTSSSSSNSNSDSEEETGPKRKLRRRTRSSTRKKTKLSNADKKKETAKAATTKTAKKKQSSSNKTKKNPPKTTTKTKMKIKYKCNWRGTLGDYLDRHAEHQCPFSKATCDLCQESMPGTQLERHQQHSCTHRFVSCTNRGCHMRMEARNLSSHLRESCPKSVLACPHCRHRMPRESYGTIQYDRALHKRVYTGHLQVCPKLKVQCDFAHHGCRVQLPRDQMPDHLRDQGQEHAQMLSHVLTKVVDQQRWKIKTLVWTIPKDKVCRILVGGGLESQRVKVGDFMAFLVLVADTNNNNNHNERQEDDDDEMDEDDDPPIKLKLCVEEPLYTPFLRHVQVHSEPPPSPSSQSTATTSCGSFDCRTLVIDTAREMLQDDHFEKDTCSVATNLMYNNNNNDEHGGGGERRVALLSDLLSFCQRSSSSSSEEITLRTTFSLKCPELISVACAN
mgnify:CR=1 FL=1